MSKNYMTIVAVALGVEMGDTFKIVNTDSNIEDEKYFQLTKKGLETSADGIYWRGTVPSVLQDLMTGKARVVALPWKPADGQAYYVPGINPAMYNRYTWSHEEDEDEFDGFLLKHRLIYKTKEEAIALTEKMLAVAKEDRND